MPDIWMDVDVNVTVPVSAMPLVDRTDFISIEPAILFNEAGMNISWNFVTPAGVVTNVGFVPTSAGVHDWVEEGTDEGMYSVEIPSSGGTVNNDLEGVGWISGETGSTLPFRGPTIGFRAAALNDALIEGGDLLDVNVLTMAANVLTASAIATGALDDKGNWNVGKTGYALTQVFPTNFADLSIVVTTGLVDITQVAADKVWGTTARTLTAFSTALAVSVWDVLESAVIIASTMGLKLKTNLNALITSRQPSGAVDLNADQSTATIGTVNNLAAAAQDAIARKILPQINIALSDIVFMFVDSVDHVTPVTGATGMGVERSIDGSAFVTGTGTGPTEISDGFYQYDASAADMNGAMITFRFFATGGTPNAPDDRGLTIFTAA